MWEQSYRAGTTPWRRQSVNPAFATWFAKSTGLRGKAVLIPGAGTSHEPLEFCRRGARVMAVDMAPSAVAYQQGVLLSEQCDAEVICDDFLTYESAQRFDIAYEQTCLCAITPAQRSQYEAQIRRLLKTEGLLYILFLQTSSKVGPPYNCDQQEMRRLFGPEHWQWESSTPLRSGHPIGAVEFGYVLTLHKRES